VRHGRIREDVAVRFFHDIVDGLSYVHGKEIAHRDLKPVSAKPKPPSTTGAQRPAACKLTSLPDTIEHPNECRRTS